MPIFDQGYQHWSGELSGHAWRWLAVTRHGIRVGMKNRMLRYALYAAWLPALALVFVVCVWGLIERQSAIVATFVQMLAYMQPKLVAEPIAYRADVWRLAYGYFFWVELRFSMLLILLMGPALISQDLRFNALPLYLSRPVRRSDYFIGKLGVIVVFLGMVVIAPSLLAYVLGLAFSLDLSIIRDTYGILLASLAYGAIISLSGGLLILALSATSRSSRYVALFWLGLWFVGGIVSSSLQAVDSEQRRDQYFRELGPRPRFNEVSQRERSEWQERRQQANTKYRIAELEFSKRDWRPLVSYTADLSRIGQQLLGNNETWERISDLQPTPQARDRLRALYMGPQFPWYWSGAVLAGLFGLSACILHFSVKSLDRLK